MKKGIYRIGFFTPKLAHDGRNVYHDDELIIGFRVSPKGPST